MTPERLRELLTYDPEATHYLNRQNQSKAQANNQSGYRGVCWHKQHRKWYASLRVADKQRFLGLFDTPELAHDAYLKAKNELHPFWNSPRLVACA